MIAAEPVASTLYFPTVTVGNAAETPPQPFGLCVGVPWQNADPVEPLLRKLGYPDWCDWHWCGIADPFYSPMAYMSLEYDQIQASRRYPDRLWFAPNEPEAKDQSDMTPTMTAALLQRMTDLGMRVAGPGVQINDIGMAWMREFVKLAAWRRMAAWNVHIYVKTADQWSRLVDDWLAFIQSIGGDHLPTVISETSGWVVGVEENIAIMDRAAERAAQDERIQAAFWFASRYSRNNERRFDNVALADGAGNLTTLGHAFADWKRRGY